MRLIDADAFEEFIRKNCADSLVDLWRELVRRQPTAYYIDGVVGQLKTDSSVKLYGSGNSNNYLIPLKKAIEIVKAGGTCQ
jgi:hypothetical protein